MKDTTMKCSTLACSLRSSLVVATLCAATASMAQTVPAAPQLAPVVTSLPSGPGPVPDTLIRIDQKVGAGKEVLVGAKVSVNYSGWLYKPMAAQYHGKLFDSSVGRGPFEFQLGLGAVIKGWDQGLLGMKVGGKRTLIIPADMAYGKRAAIDGAIPPDSALIFDVEILDVN